MVQVEQKKGHSSSSYLKRYEQLNYDMPQSSETSFEHFELLNYRKRLLDEYKKKQNLRVSVGKSSWVDYDSFRPEYNLREVLNDEIVIEFDNKTNLTMNWEAINETAINLYKAGISFEIWDHKGKCPHIHIHNIPIENLEKEQRRTFKKIFIRTYVPKKYLRHVDLSLTGIHLVAIEWANHWKGCYDVKRLLHKFNPQEEK